MERAQHLSTVFRTLKSRGQSKTWFARKMGINRTWLYQIHWGERPLTNAFQSRAAELLQLPEELLFLPTELRTGNGMVSEENALEPVRFSDNRGEAIAS